MTTFPAPPLITPRQMQVLRAATAMAWADGQLEPGEIELMLDQFAVLFTKSPAQQAALKQELSEYMGQNIPLEEVIPMITDQGDRNLVLKLGYQVINASRRNPNEAQVNPEEATAYQKLIALLGFSPAQVAELEAQVELNLEPDPTNPMIELANQLHRIITPD
ncbi:MAG: TerB family tellurite resistance protein [Pseudanabaenaceae cyanobacterium bins.68]|nr:TerB family tellurite resistance protein [Pseudanabaenaceae cyanobacterium bins.68]